MAFSSNRLLKPLTEQHTKQVFNAHLSIHVPIDANGDTKLHSLIRNSLNAETLAFSLCSMNSEAECQAMAQILNNQGESIFDLLNKRNFEAKHAEVILSVLKQYNMGTTYKSLQARIYVKKVLKTIDKNHLNTNLINNINIACSAVNQARSLFSESSTHPTLNNSEDILKKIICHKISDIRETVYDNLKNAIQRDKDIVSFRMLVKALEENNVGNCDEYAYAAAYFAKFDDSTNTESLNVEIFSIQNGDHVFVVIGRDPLSDSNDALSWGNQAVICDPWSLEVFPAYQLKSKLTSYKCYQDDFDKVYLNMIFSYNSDFHKLKAKIALTPHLDNNSLKVKKNLTLPKISKIAGNSFFNSSLKDASSNIANRQCTQKVNLPVLNLKSLT